MPTQKVLQLVTPLKFTKQSVAAECQPSGSQVAAKKCSIWKEDAPQTDQWLRPKFCCLAILVFFQCFGCQGSASAPFWFHLVLAEVASLQSWTWSCDLLHDCLVVRKLIHRTPNLHFVWFRLRQIIQKYI